jgi:hypothetical protein
VKKPTLIRPDGDPAVSLSPGAIECIKLLEDALDNAKQGEITTCMLIACGPLDFGMAMAGPDAARLNLGLDVAKRTILDRTSPPVGGGRSVLHR